MCIRDRCARPQSITFWCFLVAFLTRSTEYSGISVGYKYRASAMLSQFELRFISVRLEVLCRNVIVCYNCAELLCFILVDIFIACEQFLFDLFLIDTILLITNCLIVIIKAGD